MSWRPRIAFCVGVVFAVLVMWPFPLGLIPGAGALRAVAMAPIEWGIDALASLLGVGPVSRAPTGSGDTLYAYLRVLLVAGVAVVGGVAWAIAGGRRSYHGVAAVLRVWLRYWLAIAMLGYGLAKLFPLQFDVPLEYMYDQRVGDKSPMGLLWLMMGHSRPYTMVTGLVEVVAGSLLIWRRTQVIGALVAIVAMTQIVLLNFCYDVPVKLFSLQLLAAALAIAAPDLRRLAIAALGRATPEIAPRVRGTMMFERVRLTAKLALLAVFFVGWFEFHRTRLDRPPPSELDGTWDVTTFVLDGQAREPLTTDASRWQRVVITRSVLHVRFMTDARGASRVRIDEQRKQLELPRGVTWEALTYARPDADHLVLDGVLAEHRYHVELARAPTPLLPSRGFHWIQEEPFHR